MKQIGEPRRVTAPDALGRDSTCWHTTYEIESSDANTVRENYLGFRHRSMKLTRGDVGRSIIVMTDGTGWTCWSFHPPIHPDTNSNHEYTSAFGFCQRTTERKGD